MKLNVKAIGFGSFLLISFIAGQQAYAETTTKSHTNGIYKLTSSSICPKGSNTSGFSVKFGLDPALITIQPAEFITVCNYEQRWNRPSNSWSVATNACSNFQQGGTLTYAPPLTPSTTADYTMNIASAYIWNGTTWGIHSRVISGLCNTSE